MKEVELNSEFEFEKKFSANDVKTFSEISEDNNPIHLDKEYAAKSIFKKRVVHGILLTSMFSKIFGTIYPGEGGIYLSQAAKFKKPAFIGEIIKAKVQLTEFDDDKKRGIFLCACFNQQGELLLKGEAQILFPKEFNLISNEK